MYQQLRTSFKALLLLLAPAIITSCGSYRSQKSINYVDPSEMTWLVQQQMAKYKHDGRCNMRLEHSRFCFSGGVPFLHLEISSQDVIELATARDVLVDFVEDLSKKINLNPIVSKQIPNYPFTPEQFDIEINFETFLGKFVDPFYISCVHLKNGMAHYYAFDVKNEDRYSWHSRVESYSTTRDVSLLGRAAAKENDIERDCHMEYLKEQYLPAHSNCFIDDKF